MFIKKFIFIMFITINNLQKQYTDYNTVSDFRYHFKEPLDIDESWEVALLSIHVSTSTRVTDLIVSCDFIESLLLLNEKNIIVYIQDLLTVFYYKYIRLYIIL